MAMCVDYFADLAVGGFWMDDDLFGYTRRRTLLILTDPQHGSNMLFRYIINPYPANVDNMASSYQC